VGEFRPPVIVAVGSKYEGAPLRALSAEDLRDLLVQSSRDRKVAREVEFELRCRARAAKRWAAQRAERRVI
jgi:hypothetical protein